MGDRHSGKTTFIRGNNKETGVLLYFAYDIFTKFKFEL